MNEINEIREKIQRWQIKAEQFLVEDTKTFIIDINKTYFFCHILVVGENKITFIPFKGNNSGQKVIKYWADILKFEEYMEMKL